MADEKLKARLGLDNSEFKKGLKDSEGQLAGLNASFRNLAGAVGLAFGIHEVVAFSKEAMKLSATLEGVEAGFERIATPGLLNDIRTATRGAVGDLELMKTAVQASNFQIPLEQLASLLKFASARAIQTGQSVEYLTQSIILGIGRKSPLILDNLGISAVRLREVLKGAGVEMSTVGDVAAAVGKIATQELAKMGDVADTSATQMERFAVASERLKESWGEFVNKELGPKREILTWWLNTMNDIFSDPNLTQLQKITMHPDKYIQYKKDRGYTDLDPMGKGTESTGGALEQGTKVIEKRTDTIASLNEQLKTEKENLEKLDVADKNGIATQLKVIDTLEKRIKSLTTIRQESFSLEKLTVPKGFTEENFNPWQKLWDDYADFQKIQDKLAPAPDFKAPQIRDITNELMLQNDAINILANGFDSFFSSTEGGFKGMMDTIISELQRLINYYISKAVIFGLIKAFFPESTLVSGGFGKFMGFPGFADGGLAFGPQLAMVGENSSRSNPEVIMPMNKLSSMMGGQIVEVKGTIKGKDIALALRRNG